MLRVYFPCMHRLAPVLTCPLFCGSVGPYSSFTLESTHIEKFTSRRQEYCEKHTLIDIQNSTLPLWIMYSDSSTVATYPAAMQAVSYATSSTRINHLDEPMLELVVKCENQNKN